jgi:hypothetical protein
MGEFRVVGVASEVAAAEHGHPAHWPQPDGVRTEAKPALVGLTRGLCSGRQLGDVGQLHWRGGELQQHLDHPLLLRIAEFREDRQAEHL